MTAADDRVGVLVVDDSAESRAAIENVILQTPGFELVGSVASGEEALGVLPGLDPDLVLLDVRMPGLKRSGDEPLDAGERCTFRRRPRLRAPPPRAAGQCRGVRSCCGPPQVRGVPSPARRAVGAPAAAWQLAG